MNTLGDVVVAKRKKKAKANSKRKTGLRSIVKKIRAAGLVQPHHQGYFK